MVPLVFGPEAWEVQATGLPDDFAEVEHAARRPPHFARLRGVVAVASAGLGFLLAVLWFDLMFDVQVRAARDSELPPEVRSSIATYYRRVLIGARPMNRLVAVAMLVTLGALVAEVVAGTTNAVVAFTSLLLAGAAIGLAAVRTVRNAIRLGRERDDAEVQTQLAHRIFRDHVACIVAISAALLLQVTLG